MSGNSIKQVMPFNFLGLRFNSTLKGHMKRIKKKKKFMDENDPLSE